jgi:hypothetical protein
MTILVLKFLMPEVFQAFEGTLLQFFDLAGAMFDHARAGMQGSLPPH